MEPSIRPIVAEPARMTSAARSSSAAGKAPFAILPDRERPRREPRDGEPQERPADERAVAPPADDEAGSHLDLLA